MENSSQEERQIHTDCPLIEEERYLSDMREIAEPYLMKRRKEVTLRQGEEEFLFCVCYAPEEMPRGLVLVSHGFTETAEKYREVSYYLLQSGYAVLVMEHCGHGRSYDLRKESGTRKRDGAESSLQSPGPAAYSAARDRIFIDRWERYRDDLLFTAHHARAVFEAEYHVGDGVLNSSGRPPEAKARDRETGYEKVPLLVYAHSMGGGIAAAAAAAEPSLFAGVILSSPMIRPTSGGLPWGLTKLICGLFCRLGKDTAYAPGQGPYNPEERFEESAGCSEPRFRYYQEFRRTHEFCQMGGATYGWMNAAAQLSDWLLREGWKSLTCPVLLFQADNDSFVMNARQDAFIRNLQEHGGFARLIHVPGTRHEIFNSHNDVLEMYWGESFAFYQKCVTGEI